MLTRPSRFKSGDRPATTGVLVSIFNGPPPPPPVIVIEGAGVGVVVVPALTEIAGKFKNPPRKMNEVLEEIPVPGWPILPRPVKFEEDAKPPPASTMPDSSVNDVELARSARAETGNNTNALAMSNTPQRIHLLRLLRRKILDRLDNLRVVFQILPKHDLVLGNIHCILRPVEFRPQFHQIQSRLLAGRALQGLGYP